MRTNTDLGHALQLRLSNSTVADMDEMIATVPQLQGFNRCRFIRAALAYALASLAEDGYPRKVRGATTQEKTQ